MPRQHHARAGRLLLTLSSTFLLGAAAGGSAVWMTLQGGGPLAAPVPERAVAQWPDAGGDADSVVTLLVQRDRVLTSSPEDGPLPAPDQGLADEEPEDEELTVSVALDLPDETAAGAARSETLVVQRGDTLFDLLRSYGISRAEAHEAVTILASVYDPHRLRPGQELTLAVEDGQADDASQRIVSLALSLGMQNDVVLARDTSGLFNARTLERELVHETAHVAGSIDDSLYDSAVRNGLPLETLSGFTKLFSWDVDFQRDIQPGDGFEIVYDQILNDRGELVQGGDLLFASLLLSGRELNAYRFESSDGTVDYYDQDGRSVRKWLMRTPVDGARMSSRFGPRRHPILGYNRMHKGVDFAAPRGTPVYAAGDGTVAVAERNKGYGNYIRIRHNGEYDTAYGHLDHFAKGLKRGARVRQGDIIGYVGATGLATGPHLHYEVLKDSAQINPLSIQQVAADPLSGAERRRFESVRAAIDRQRVAPKEQVVAQHIPTE